MVFGHFNNALTNRWNISIVSLSIQQQCADNTAALRSNARSPNDFRYFFIFFSFYAELGITSNLEFYLFDFNRFALNMELRHFVVTQLFIDIENGE